MNSWVKLSTDVLSSNFGKLGLPYKLTYIVTKECHSRCVNCKIWRIKPQNELTLDEVTQFARNSPFLSWIDFTGGEPTDRPDFVQVVKAFLDHCPNLIFVHFPCNGLKPDRIEQVAKEIIALKPKRFVVTVSIDGPSKVNDGIRGIKGDFTSAVETYRRLSQLKELDVFVGMTLYPNNVHTLDQMVSEIQAIIPEFSYKKVHVNVPHVSGHYYGNTEHTDERPSATIPDVIKSLMKKRGIPLKPFEWVERLYHNQVAKYIETGKTPIDCSSIMSSTYLAEEGTLYPCSIWDAPLGNIRQSGYSLVPLVQSARSKLMREKIKKKDCPNCWTPCDAYPSIAASIIKTTMGVG
ncbi:MAG: radical SAM protein [Xanthomonadaceae bacterium]|nr:radical SAM protein [Xanthomonadaceae bacterium]